MQNQKALCMAVIMLLSASVGTAGAFSLNEGLVAHYSFNDCTATDSSGIGNNGTFLGSNQCVQGVNGKAIKFAGPNNRGYLTIPNNPSLSFLDNYTFATWLNIQSNVSMDGNGSINNYGTQSIFAKAGDRSGLGVKAVRDPKNGSLHLITSNGRAPYSDFYTMATSQEFNLNEWHMVTVTSGGGNVKVYFDCKLQSTVPTSLFKVNTTMQSMPMQLGVDQAATWYPINGIIDEARVYNRALSGQDVKDLYVDAGLGYCPGNQPPISNAGPDQMVSCDGIDGTEATLGGSQSSDPDGDPLTYTWTWSGGSVGGVHPTVTLPLGATPVTLTVNDGQGGTAADTMMVTVKDDVPPVTTIQSIAGIAGILGENGWFKSLITVNLNAADNCSGVKEIHAIGDGGMAIVPGRSAAITLSKEGTNSFSYYAVDNAGISETPHLFTAQIDKTPPVIVASVNEMPNTAGWYNGDKTVTFACTDAVSGIASCLTPIEVTSEGAGQVVTGTAVDNAGNKTTTSVKLSIDKTPPVIVASVKATPNAAGWHNGDVTVTFACTDAVSGIASCQSPIKATNEGAGQVITGTAVDNARNATATSVKLSIDKTPPVIVASVNATPNAAKWYSGDVTVTFVCTDAVSGIASCQSPIMVTSEGAGQVVTGTAVDNAGNTTTISVKLSMDKTPPIVSVAATPSLLWPPNHKMVTVKPSVTVTDASPGKTVKLVSVTSSEPDNGLGDGDTANDVVVNSDGTLSLRAERSGNGSGRVYTITYQVVDLAGNTATASAIVTVPLNR
jgi:hypothetical protein